MTIKNIRSNRLAIGDLKDRATVYKREIDAFNDSPAIEYTLTLVKKVFCKFKTISPYQKINGETPTQDATHLIYLRNKGNTEIDTDNLISYRGNLFKILELIDFDEDNRYRVLTARLNGDDDNASSPE